MSHRRKTRAIFGSLGIFAVLFVSSEAAAAESCGADSLPGMDPQAIRETRGIRSEEMDCQVNTSASGEKGAELRELDLHYKRHDKPKAGACLRTARAADSHYKSYLAQKREACPLAEQAKRLKDCKQSDCLGNAARIAKSGQTAAEDAGKILKSADEELKKLREFNLEFIDRVQKRFPIADEGTAKKVAELLQKSRKGEATLEEIRALKGDRKIDRLREQFTVALFAQEFVKGMQTEAAKNKEVIADLTRQHETATASRNKLGADPPNKSTISPRSPTPAPGSSLGGTLDALTKMAGLGMIGMQLAAMNQTRNSPATSGVSPNTTPPKDLFAPTGAIKPPGAGPGVQMTVTPKPGEAKLERPELASQEFGAGGNASSLTPRRLFTPNMVPIGKTEVSDASGNSTGASTSPLVEEKSGRAVASVRKEDTPDIFSGGQGTLGAPDAHMMNAGAPSGDREDTAVKDLLAEMDQSLKSPEIAESHAASDGNSETEALSAFNDTLLGSSQGAREQAAFSVELQGISLFTRVRNLHERCLKKGCVVHGLNSKI